MSPLWGLGLWGFGVAINMSPLWGYVGSLVHVNITYIALFPNKSGQVGFKTGAKERNGNLRSLRIHLAVLNRWSRARCPPNEKML